MITTDQAISQLMSRIPQQTRQALCLRMLNVEEDFVELKDNVGDVAPPLLTGLQARPFL